ncbi:MAG TPA: DUF3343 domain-containing protein [Selenomonadales bacterium]|nr:DUF3343 domain-containing protein [Selenomonadales bacterium]
MREEFWVITFPSIFHALRGEKLLAASRIPAKLIAVPRELTGSCEGLAARLEGEEVARAVAVLRENGVQMVKEGVKITR